MSPLEQGAQFGGFVMAHAALVASDLEEGELICPFAVVAHGDNRQVLDFEAETQAEAVERGKSSLYELRDRVDLWAFAREGLMPQPNSPDKVDVLLVSAWAQGMEEPLVLIQAFVPAANGAFALLGDLELHTEGQSLALEAQPGLLAQAEHGIATHPRNVPWAEWHRHKV